MAPAVTSLGEEMDDIEEDVLDGSANVLREQIVSIRKKAIIFKRYMAPQRALTRLAAWGNATAAP